MEIDYSAAKYSVLMSVYAKEKAEYLKVALQSIFDQTLFPDEIVLVCDGPLTEELDEVIDWAEKLHPQTMRVVRLKENGGLGHALRTAVPLCKNEVIMRADSDDINLPERAETEIRVILESGYDVVSSTVSIFYESPDVIEGERRLPATHDEIVKFVKSRCPFNHPAVMFRKSKVLEVGNYPDVAMGGEDYGLWAKMLVNGARGHNIETPLVLMRMDRNSYGRRKSKDYYESRMKVGKYMRDKKFLSLFGYWKFRFSYWAAYACPVWLDQLIYKKVLHRKKETKGKEASKE